MTTFGNRNRSSLGLLLSLLFMASMVQAQPRAIFQSGTPQGLGNMLSVTRVPVVDSTGAVKYYDVTLAFNVDGAGRLTLNPSGTRILASPNLTVGAFTPGIYEGGPSHCDHTVGTPGVTGGGRISGSIADSNCNLSVLRFNAAWVSGPIAGHPNEAALRAAGITFQGYSWGVLGDIGDDWADLGWAPGHVIGVIQSGRQLTLHDFGNDNKEDRSIVFTLCTTCR